MDNLAAVLPLECDEGGFLVDPNKWNLSVAYQLARMHGINTLDARQWALIYTLRQYYFSSGHLPPLRRICHIHDMQNNCISALFENHGIEAWRIAGLPDPGEEAKSYM